MKRIFKNLLGVSAIVLLSAGVAGITTYKVMDKSSQNSISRSTNFNDVFENSPTVRMASYNNAAAQPVDLTVAAENSLHAVVHIKSIQHSKVQTYKRAPDIFDFFFGYDERGSKQRVQTPSRVGFGSGVIISSDGYIVTNNHVIDGADEISVKLNDNRDFLGRVIGTEIGRAHV